MQFRLPAPALRKHVVSLRTYLFYYLLTQDPAVVGNLRTSNPKSKPRKHVTTQPLGSPQVHVQVVANTKRKPGQYPPSALTLLIGLL